MKCVEFKVQTKPWDRVWGLIENVLSWWIWPGGVGSERVQRRERAGKGASERIVVRKQHQN